MNQTPLRSAIPWYSVMQPGHSVKRKSAGGRGMSPRLWRNATPARGWSAHDRA